MMAKMEKTKSRLFREGKLDDEIMIKAVGNGGKAPVEAPIRKNQ